MVILEGSRFVPDRRGHVTAPCVDGTATWCPGIGHVVPHGVVVHPGVGPVPQHWTETGVSAGGSALWGLGVLPEETSHTRLKHVLISWMLENPLQLWNLIIYLISLAISFWYLRLWQQQMRSQMRSRRRSSSRRAPITAPAMTPALLVAEGEDMVCGHEFQL